MKLSKYKVFIGMIVGGLLYIWLKPITFLFVLIIAFVGKFLWKRKIKNNNKSVNTEANSLSELSISERLIELGWHTAGKNPAKLSRNETGVESLSFRIKDDEMHVVYTKKDSQGVFNYPHIKLLGKGAYHAESCSEMTPEVLRIFEDKTPTTPSH